MGWTDGSTCKLDFTLDSTRVLSRFSNLVEMVLMVEIKVSRVAKSTTPEDPAILLSTKSPIDKILENLQKKRIEGQETEREKVI